MIEFPGYRPRYFPRDFRPDPSRNELEAAGVGGEEEMEMTFFAEPPEVVPEAFTFVLPRASYQNYKAKNLLFDFYNWHSRAHFIGVRDNDAFPKREYKRIANNHFQGIQRLNDGIHVVLSGGSKQSHCSNLFITKLGSHRRGTGSIGTNLMRGSKPDEEDILEAIILLDDAEYWHAGGISTCGDILVVPLERDEIGARIVFLNMKDPVNPIQYQNEIFRPNGKAGSASLIRLPNGYFLCAVWTEHTGHHFNFYLSDVPDITSTYERPCLRVNYEDIVNNNKMLFLKKSLLKNITFLILIEKMHYFIFQDLSLSII